MRWNRVAWVVVATVLAGGAAAGEAFDVPRLADIAVDGKPGDWADGGFRVDVLSDPAARPRPLASLDATVRLGWDEGGLLVLLAVADDVAHEADRTDQLWRADSAELFVATAPGEADRWQAIIAPGLDARHPKLRHHLYDYRATSTLKATTLAIEAARAKTATGYTMEARLPWKALGIQPAAGREVAFQVYVNDTDGAGDRTQLRWFPEEGAQRDTRRMHRLRLAEKPGPPVTAVAAGSYERFRRTRICVTATAASAGATAQMVAQGKVLGEAKLAREGRLARGVATLPMPPRGKPYGPLAVAIGGKSIATVTLPNADSQRAEAFARAALRFDSYVFSGTAFPSVDFAQPSLVEDLVGRCELKAAFYDATHAPVTVARKPGRYGAIVEAVPEHGKPRTWFVTLYRLAGDIRWWRLELPVTLIPPKQLGLDAAVAREQYDEVAGLVKGGLSASFEHNPDSAIALAGLQEMRPGTPAVRRTGAWARNDWWWHALRKKTGHLVPLRYLVHLPPGAALDRGRKWPTILFLHGAGERGDDLKLVEIHGPPKLVKTRRDFPFVVLSPQCPRGRWWSVPLLDELLKEAVAKYPIDPDRICLTGLSMGGFGSWALACEYPERFAAVVPICGGGDSRDVERIKDVPVWMFHGGKDGVVPVREGEQMVAALRALGGRVRFTVYPEANHDSWTATYDNPKLYQWLLRQRRGH